MWPRDSKSLWVAGMGLLLGSGCATGWQGGPRPLTHEELERLEDNYDQHMTFKPVLPPDAPDLSFFDEHDMAADALARIGAESVPELCVALRSSNPRLRRYAALALARAGSNAAPAVPELVERLRDDDAAVRQNAARALGQIGPAARDAIPALIRVLGEDEFGPVPMQPVPSLATPIHKGAALRFAARITRWI